MPPVKQGLNIVGLSSVIKHHGPADPRLLNRLLQEESLVICRLQRALSLVLFNCENKNLPRAQHLATAPTLHVRMSPPSPTRCRARRRGATRRRATRRRATRRRTTRRGATRRRATRRGARRRGARRRGARRRGPRWLQPCVCM